MKHIPINLYMTGDLAFYSLVLGKENMSGHWCWRCDLNSREWQDLTKVGQCWTLAGMEEHRKKLKV